MHPTLAGLYAVKKARGGKPATMFSRNRLPVSFVSTAAATRCQAQSPADPRLA